MSHLKKYIEFIKEDVKSIINESDLVSFLIAKENELKIGYFGPHGIEGSGYTVKLWGIIKYNFKREEIPPQKFEFDIVDYAKWIHRSRHSNGEAEKKSCNIKLTEILTGIINPNPSEFEKSLISKIFNSENAWETSLQKIKKITDKLLDINIEDFEDRVIEFSDQLPNWRVNIVKTITSNFTHNNAVDIDNSLNKNTINIGDINSKVLMDIFHIMGRLSKDFMSCINSLDPCFLINLQSKYMYAHNNTDEIISKPELYSTIKVQEVIILLSDRLKNLYHIKEVTSVPSVDSGEIQHDIYWCTIKILLS